MSQLRGTSWIGAEWNEASDACVKEAFAQNWTTKAMSLKGELILFFTILVTIFLDYGDFIWSFCQTCLHRNCAARLCEQKYIGESFAFWQFSLVSSLDVICWTSMEMGRAIGYVQICRRFGSSTISSKFIHP